MSACAINLNETRYTIIRMLAGKDSGSSGKSKARDTGEIGAVGKRQGRYIGQPGTPHVDNLKGQYPYEGKDGR